LCAANGYKFRVKDYHASNILKRMNIDNPTEQQKKEAEKMAIKEHQIIVFAYRSRQILKIN